MLRVLFVEDDRQISEVTIEALRAFGHEVVAVDKAELALEELGRGIFDLILTDNDTKSEKSGLDVVDMIRNDAFYKEIAGIPIIIFSGDLIEAETLKLNALYLFKPCRRAALRVALDHAVEQQVGSPIR